MYLSDFIVKFEDFLSGIIDKENFLSFMEPLENTLLDMEESFRETGNSVDAIVKSLEIIDDISICLEEEEPCFDELKVCLKKLTELKEFFDVLEEPSPVSENKFFDRAAHKSVSAGQLRFSEPSFDFHPQMKFKMPQVQTDFEPCELSDIELKASPLYSLIEFAKSYMSSGRPVTGFSEILEQTCRELCKLTEETDISDNDFIDFIDDCLDRIGEMEEFIEEPDFMEEVPDFIEELTVLNEKFITFQKRSWQDKTVYDKVAMTEEKLIEDLYGRVCQDDFITSNYLLIRNKLEDFLNNETGEDDIKQILASLKEIIISVRDDYEKSYISPEEWTLEVYTSDKLLSEGLNTWEEGLAALEQCFRDRSNEEIGRAISIIFEGNKKLVLNQYLAKYIEEQLMVSKTYSEKDFSEE
ncbi:MAG: hypothetical protein ABRQ37_01710 [Candidatus Eremiobacterota bacterium]